MGRQTLNLIASIGAQQGLTPAEIRAMQATSRVESRLDPSAVGDHGTSFGLFQHHVGGAGGPDLESAKRYLDPRTSITERAKWFKRNHIVNGEGAAALQRPADPRGYAAKVNAALKGIPTHLNAPIDVAGTPAPQQSGGRDSFALQYLRSYLGYDRTPQSQSLFDSYYGGSEPARQPSNQSAVAPAAPLGAGNRSAPPLASYKDILALGKAWGLRIDGANQTTGGSHVSGSKHYSGKAVDFGDAKNDPAKLKAFARYLARNAGSLGIADIWYTPLGWSVDNGHRTTATIGGHNDHLHVDVT